ncbi:coiled-coil domain-containing protein 144A-like [Caloenas nicobarica]|uniref:coiled-coil domain-containing protein 144A-like n=1 Tax=Caloenas nicobarica TaxID=187106 RepID=UPI0032B85724
MERLLRFLRRRTARVTPLTPGSSDGNEPQPQVRDELWLGEGANESNSAGPEAEDARAPESTAGSGPSSFCRIHGRCHTSESVDLWWFQRDCEQRLHVDMRVSEVLEANGRLDEELNKAKTNATRLEIEVNLLKKALGKKTVALRSTTEELRQARQQSQEWQALYCQRDQERKDAVQRAEGLQEQVAQLQGENLQLRQQLGDAQNKAAQEPLREVGRPAEASLAAGPQQDDCLKQGNPHLQEDLDKVKAKVHRVCERVPRLELFFSFSDRKRRKSAENKHSRDLCEDILSFTIITIVFQRFSRL